MNQETVWLLLKEGYNAGEIAAAAGVMLPTALGMIREATPQGEVIPAMNHASPSARGDGLKLTAHASQTSFATSGMGSR